MLLAIAALRYANQKKPDNKDAEALLGVLESKFPKESQAELPLEGMDMVEQKLEVALNLIYDSKYTQAIQELNEVLILDPNNVTAYKRMGSAYFALKNKAKAREVWMKARQLSPNDKELQSFLKQ